MRRIILATLVISLVPVSASQAKPASPPIHKRPTHLVAADLGVPEQVFIDCFSGVSPEASHDPSVAQQHANKAILLPCLQAENPSITNEKLDSVMDKYRPEGPMPKP